MFVVPSFLSYRGKKTSSRVHIALSLFKVHRQVLFYAQCSGVSEEKCKNVNSHAYYTGTYVSNIYIYIYIDESNAVTST